MEKKKRLTKKNLEKEFKKNAEAVKKELADLAQKRTLRAEDLKIIVRI